MKEKERFPAFLGVSFVWFTTQFGGGFASGRQVFDYFIQFGWFAVFTPVLAQLLQALFFYYIFKFAVENRTYNYRSFTDGFYGRSSTVMSNLYEIVYNVTICLATSVAFATGGTTLEQLTGLSYLTCTLLIGAAIFFLTIYGAALVRKAASVISLLIIAGMLLVFIPNVFAKLPDISASLIQLKASSPPGSVWTALWKCFLYAAFQMAAVGVYISHTEILGSKEDIKKSMTAGFIINASIILLTTLGLLSILDKGASTAKIPTLLLVQTGIGSSWMTPIIFTLILVGAVSTGVNMVYGIVNRITASLGKNETEELKAKKIKSRSIICSLIYIILTFSIAQLGLIPLVSKGYAYLGYITIFGVIIPVVFKAFFEIFEKKSVTIQG